jgi:hypothetical protein
MKRFCGEVAEERACREGKGFRHQVLLGEAAHCKRGDRVIECASTVLLITNTRWDQAACTPLTRSFESHLHLPHPRLELKA